ncbi:MAG: sn-glycerol-3-phosphate ABC transporter permease UgpA [Halobacteriovoraceae bacterium]|nr:sn-glycerol-3-phosphate ABC transporter permease UgpA [Halobacteriovoraceae bacterium]
MDKKSIYPHRFLPYFLIAPQILITFVFFIWPAGVALKQAFLISDPFGGESEFVWFEIFEILFEGDQYLNSFARTLGFSFATVFLSMSIGLLMAVLINRTIRYKRLTRTITILPYAMAPAIAGILWMFLFHPTFGSIGYFLNNVLGFEWNPTLNESHAFILVIIAASWKQISYNFVFFTAGLQAIPKSILEAAVIDGAGPIKRFWSIIFPLLSPTLFFLMIMNMIYSFFDTFGIIHTTTEGGPGGATNILVYKVYTDGFVGLDLGQSAAQSVILMILTIFITIFQFKFIEKKVNYL